MTSRQTLSTLPEGFAGSNFCSEILVSHDGRHVYVGNRLHDSVGIFRVLTDGTSAPVSICSGFDGKKLKEAETSRLIQQQKDRLDGFLTQTLSIEEKILETKDLKLLSELLAKVSRIKLKALQELTEEELRGDQTFAIFLEQCDSLIHQIQLQRIARNTAST